MTKEEIKQIIPHRDAMLLLDEVEQEEDTAVGTLRIRGDEWFLQGHFPGNPVVPGVILCEILAQSSCILLKDVMTEGKLPFYTGMNNVRFRSPVKPETLLPPAAASSAPRAPSISRKGADMWTESSAYRASSPSRL